MRNIARLDDSPKFTNHEDGRRAPMMRRHAPKIRGSGKCKAGSEGAVAHSENGRLPDPAPYRMRVCL
jgi:hypothetical protein